MAELTQARLHAVVSSSWRLREEATAALIAPWTGRVQRKAEPGDVPSLLADLDTPSLFGDSALVLVRAEAAWAEKHRELLVPLVGQPVLAGILVLSLPALPRNQALGKRLDAAGCYHQAEPPTPREIEAWLVGRLLALPGTVDKPAAVAQLLLRHRGQDPDALLAAVDQLLLLAGESPIDAVLTESLLSGDAEGPVWTFVDAVLGGQAGKAIRLLHAGAGMDPHGALAALANELRKCLCVLAARDDGEAIRLMGGRGGGSLYHARRRAGDLGRRCLERLLNGVYQAQVDLRRSGSDPRLVVETLTLNAQRVIRLA